MPQGPGTYRGKVGRPAKKKASSALGALFSPDIVATIGGSKPAKKARKQMAKTDARRKKLFDKLRKKLGAQFTDAEAQRALQLQESRRRARRTRK
tara:strand:+ start:946 stop:1230 length:285 start_codon:yes stop_codon:yes gene_type:complete